jgi:hypothetical protein
MKKISYEKLSELQKLILVALCEARYAAMKRREFRRLIKRLYFGGKDSRSIRAALSRSLSRLEKRGYIIGSRGGWQLTDWDGQSRDPSNNGFTLAFLAWGNRRELYALVGLKGPPLEALGINIKPPSEARLGVEVELDC